MDTYFDAIRHVTTARHDVRRSIQDSAVDWLLDTAACAQCATYVSEHHHPEPSRILDRRERCLGGRLLLVLAAMQLANEHETRQALVLQGAGGVDARGDPPSERYRNAGQSLRKPVTARSYQRGGHLLKLQQALAEELYILVTRPDSLSVVLELHGAEAVARHL
jgi:hypothetical protein